MKYASKSQPERFNPYKHKVGFGEDEWPMVEAIGYDINDPVCRAAAKLRFSTGMDVNEPYV